MMLKSMESTDNNNFIIINPMSLESILFRHVDDELKGWCNKFIKFMFIFITE